VRNPLFNVRLDPQDRQILAEVAKRDGTTLSEAARKLIRQAAKATNDDRRPANAAGVLYSP
jgi:predicted HicB family RNase H-like nuclease